MTAKPQFFLKMAASWAVVQKKHALLKCGDTVNLKSKLLQSILVPTIHYGCEVWGMHSQRTSSANSARSQLQHLYELYLRSPRPGFYIVLSYDENRQVVVREALLVQQHLNHR